VPAAHGGDTTIHAIDDLDRAIILRLQVDGRTPLRSIARELDVPEATVRARTNRLLERGTIRINAFTDPRNLGYGVLVSVLLRLAPRRRSAVLAALESWPEVMYLSSGTGSADAMIQMVARDLDALHELVDERLAGVDGILEVEAFLELAVHKTRYVFSDF